MKSNPQQQQAHHVLYTQSQIHDCVSQLAGQIRTAYTSFDDLVVIVLLMGAKRFADDLLAALGQPVSAEYLRAKSYHDSHQSSGTVHVEGHVHQPLRGKRVLLIDDIYDTGITLKFMLDYLRQFQPAEIKTCVLLEKQCPHHETVAIDFLGLPVPDVFVVGYGLDYREQYRELPFIAELTLDGN